MGKAVITLTSDFGTRDGYVAQIKGVILSLNPDVSFHDTTHEITAFGVLEGALVIKGFYKFFPVGTIHVGVVDPGVGTNRRPMILEADGHIFVGPDNGLFSFVINSADKWRAYEIVSPKLRRLTVHTTFHGRDIFAPTAAKVSAGFSPEHAGPEITDPVTLNLPKSHTRDTALHGKIIHVDRFGNLCSNIEASELSGKVIKTTIGGLPVRTFGARFAEVNSGEAIALVNSFGMLEVAINCGDAAMQMGAGVGTPISVHFE